MGEYDLDSDSKSESDFKRLDGSVCVRAAVDIYPKNIWTISLTLRIKNL